MESDNINWFRIGQMTKSDVMGLIIFYSSWYITGWYDRTIKRNHCWIFWSSPFCLLDWIQADLKPAANYSEGSSPCLEQVPGDIGIECSWGPDSPLHDVLHWATSSCKGLNTTTLENMHGVGGEAEVTRGSPCYPQKRVVSKNRCTVIGTLNADTYCSP